jgi:hypothetical protein
VRSTERSELVNERSERTFFLEEKKTLFLVNNARNTSVDD